MDRKDCLYKIIVLIFDISWVLFRLIMMIGIEIIYVYGSITQFNTNVAFLYISMGVIVVFELILQFIWTIPWWKGVKKRYHCS